MKYTATKPCADCPFLESNAESYGLERLSQFASGDFPCHKTATLVEDDDSGVAEFHATKNSVACAGALIFCEKRNAPNQMMRIAERLGMYDHTILDMTSPVV